MLGYFYGSIARIEKLKKINSAGIMGVNPI